MKKTLIVSAAALCLSLVFAGGASASANWVRFGSNGDTYNDQSFTNNKNTSGSISVCSHISGAWKFSSDPNSGLVKIMISSMGWSVDKNRIVVHTLTQDFYNAQGQFLFRQSSGVVGDTALEKRVAAMLQSQIPIPKEQAKADTEAGDEDEDEDEDEDIEEDTGDKEASKPKKGYARRSSYDDYRMPRGRDVTYRRGRHVIRRHEYYPYPFLPPFFMR